MINRWLGVCAWLTYLLTVVVKFVKYTLPPHGRMAGRKGLSGGRVDVGEQRIMRQILADLRRFGAWKGLICTWISVA